MLSLSSRESRNALYLKTEALVAQLAERILGKDEVGGSNPLEGSFISIHNTQHL